MLKKIAFCAAICLLSMPFAACQTSDAELGKQSDAIMGKIAQQDVLYFVLPLAMTKEQLNKILPTLEKIRQRVRSTQKLEAEELKKLERDLDAGIKDGLEKGKLPSGEMRKTVLTTLKKLALARDISIGTNTDEMYDALMAVWTVGQRKVAANSLDPKEYLANAKVEEMKDEEKIRLFVREIMLNPAAYGVLVKLAK